MHLARSEMIIAGLYGRRAHLRGLADQADASQQVACENGISWVERLGMRVSDFKAFEAARKDLPQLRRVRSLDPPAARQQIDRSIVGLRPVADDRVLERHCGANHRLHVGRIPDRAHAAAHCAFCDHLVHEPLLGHLRIAAIQHAIRRIEQQQRKHRFTRLPQCARHRGRNVGAGAQGAEKVRAVRTLLTHLGEIFRRHVFDVRMGRLQSVETSRLEYPHRLVVAKQLHEMRADERLAMPAMNEKQRRRVAVPPEGNEHR